MAGKNAVKSAQEDNMNILGNKERNIHYLKPYYDYTGYKPVNSATNVTDPTRWQPAILNRGPGHFGAFVSQQFITPQLRNVKPLALKNNINTVFLPPFGRSDKVNIVTVENSRDSIIPMLIPYKHNII